MSVKIVQPDPYVVMDLTQFVQMRITPYTDDRVMIQLIRLSSVVAPVKHAFSKPQPKETLELYFDIGLDDIKKIYEAGVKLCLSKVVLDESPGA